MSMTDDDLNALLAAWAKEDGSAEEATGNEIGSVESPSDTFSALTTGSAAGNLAKWQSKWQGGGQSGGSWNQGGGGWNNQNTQQKSGGGKSGGGNNKSVAQKIAAGSPVYFGKVKTFDKEKNRGYISCDEICSMCGMDVYVFGDVLSQSGGAPGDTVAFLVHWSQAGQPQASAPMLRIGEADSTGGFAMKGEFKSGSGGAGFLTSDLIKDFFGRDVWVNREYCHGLQAGMTVAFNASLNAQKQPIVDRLEACLPDWEPTLGDLSHTRTDPSVVSNAVKGGFSKGAGAGGGKDGGGDDGWGKGEGKGEGKGKGGKMAMMMQMMQLLVGDDWGDDWGGDSWGGSGGGGWNSGKGESKGGGASWGKGKSSNMGGGGGGGPPAPSGETFYGVIKSFNEKNNFGFIASEQVQEKYNGVDCFFHGKLMVGHNIGDMVEFDVGLNAKGQPQALTIRPLNLTNESEEPPEKQMRFA